MRYLEIMETAGKVPLVKAWYNPETGKAIEMNFLDKHFQVAKKKRGTMGISRLEHDFNYAAVEGNWVRISSAKEGSWDPHGYVTANSLANARKALRWMEENGVLPPTMDIETIADRKTDKFFTLSGDGLLKFMDRGIMPRNF